ncbi:MAG TPA: hypothetical protein VMG08_12365 [Allosphingosinicella sp.]|nr:hypothetical protein [Allosphingosinicella sp.]
MSPFEFAFSLFGLLLGFSLVEVLSGLVRTMKLRKQVRIGWLTPLLGLFVMVDLTSFWSAAWDSKELIPAHFAILLLGLFVSGVYYFAASMVFPDRPEEWPDFDDWAARHKRQVMGGILACNLIATAAMFAARPGAWIPAVLAPHAVLLGMMTIAAFARPRWLTGAMLAGMLGFYLWFALTTF